MDADVIKHYVQRGIGVGILSEMAVDARGADGLVAVTSSSNLFAPSITKVAFQHGSLLHAFAYRFVEILAPHLSAVELRDAALSRLSLREPKARPPINLATLPAFGQL